MTISFGIYLTQRNCGLMNCIANTQQQKLVEHMSSVGYLAWELAKHSGITQSKLLGAIYTTGCLHDLGKLDPNFQNFLLKGSVDTSIDGVHLEVPRKKSFSFDEYPRHNEISLMLVDIIRASYRGRLGKNNRAHSEYVAHGVYWHHAQPMRSKGKLPDMVSIAKIFKESLGDSWGSLLNDVTKLLVEIKSHGKSLGGPIEFLPELTTDDIEDELDDPVEHRSMFPQYKQYTESDSLEDVAIQCEENAKRSLIRAFVNTADCIVSALSPDELDNIAFENVAKRHVATHNSALSDGITGMENNFEHMFPNSERNNVQLSVANKLTKVDSIPVLSGAAGCGKTKISLSWAKPLNQDVFWICPRVGVCQGLFGELSSLDYLHSNRIELFTGELKTTYKPDGSYDTPADEFLSGDVTVMTIDQISSALTTHSGVPLLFRLINSTLIFDEYHELILSDGFNLFLKEIMSMKKLCCKNDMLLVSATPNLWFTENFLDVYRSDIVECKSFNEQPYTFTFPDFTPDAVDDPFKVPRENKSLVVTNTAKAAQVSYLQNLGLEKSMLCHSKYSPSDKQLVFKNVMTAFGKGSAPSNKVLRSSPVTQASLNISVESLVTEITNAENWCQRLGRLDRFAEGFDNEMCTPIPSVISELTKGSSKCPTSRFLSSMKQRESAFAWTAFIRKHLGDGKQHTLREVYDHYREFYLLKENQVALNNDLMKVINSSIKRVNIMQYCPVQYPKKKNSVKNDKVNRVSLRGSSCYVKVGVVDVSDIKTMPILSTNYLQERLTLSRDDIKGFGDKRKDLIDFMRKKLHHLESSTSYKDSYGGKYVVERDGMLLDRACQSLSPVYISYTGNDLDKVNSSGPDDAIYYINGEQPIGLMSLSTLQKL
jgi:CRISPR-associated endonuclease/helicase Cas3